MRCLRNKNGILNFSSECVDLTYSVRKREPAVSSKWPIYCCCNYEQQLKNKTLRWFNNHVLPLPVKGKNFMNWQKFDQKCLIASFVQHDNQFTFWIDSLSSITPTEYSAVELHISIGRCHKLHMSVLLAACSTIHSIIAWIMHDLFDCRRRALLVLFLCYCHCKIICGGKSHNSNFSAWACKTCM